MTGDERAFRFEMAGRTDPGLTRAGHANEDSFELRHDLWAAGDALIVVADGMGGAAVGEIASRDAVAAVVRTEATSDDPATAIAAAYARANEAVRRIDGGGDPGRPGTTLVAAYFLGRRCWVANVGDSRLYRFRASTLELLTHDHSLVQDEIDAGRLTEAEARDDPRSSLITRTIGGQPSVEVDQTNWPLEAGDRYLACSDGLWGVLEDEAIAELLARHSAPADAATALIDASLRAGGPDNVTAAVVRVVAVGLGRASPR